LGGFWLRALPAVLLDALSCLGSRSTLLASRATRGLVTFPLLGIGLFLLLLSVVCIHYRHRALSHKARVAHVCGKDLPPGERGRPGEPTGGAGRYPKATRASGVSRETPPGLTGVKDCGPRPAGVSSGVQYRPSPPPSSDGRLATSEYRESDYGFRLCARS
jgi:hypothetical protein